MVKLKGYDAGMNAMLLSRRSFLARSLAMSAVLPWALRGLSARANPSSSIPVGLELYSVRDELKKDPEGTVRAVAAMGYQCVEFYSPTSSGAMRRPSRCAS
jgi:hypothetical protein